MDKAWKYRNEWFYNLDTGEVYLIERQLQWELEGGHITANEYLFLKTQPPDVGLFIRHYHKFGLNHDPVLVFFVNGVVREFSTTARIFRDFHTQQELQYVSY